MMSGKRNHEIRDVPFVALGGVYEQDDVDAVLRVVGAATETGGSFFPLPEETDFHEAFAAHEGARRAVGVNSCGTALDLCMMVLGIGPGDEVITSPLTFVCTATCAVARGAQVVFADIDPETLCLNPDSVRERITDRTKAIIPVHFAGLAADCTGFDAITAETGIPIVYDAAHAVSAKHRGEPVGGRGKASCYSFQSNKNMTMLGEGGAVTSNDDDFVEQVRQKKTFGFVYSPKTYLSSIGFNFRLTKAQYAVGITQLSKIDRVIAKRLAAFRYMHELLADVEEIVRPSAIDDDHACHLYVTRLDTDRVGFSRDTFLQRLKGTYRVGYTIHYPAVWSWQAIADLGYNEREARCPIAAKACDQVFSLPLFPHTRREDCEYIAWAVKQSLVDSE